MSRNYEPEFKNKIIRLHLEEGRTYKSISEEFGVSKSAVTRWCDEYTKECQTISQNNPTAINDADLMKENLKLRRELEEAKKGESLLKKAAAFFAKEIG